MLYPRLLSISSSPFNFFLHPCCRLKSAIIPVGFITPAKSGMLAHHVSLVQLVVGLGAAWIVNLLIAKSNSLRSALKSLGCGCLSSLIWTKLTTNLHKRNCPGKGILLLHPFRNEALVGGPIFPFKGMIGYYFGKFART